MKRSIIERTQKAAQYILDHQATLRQTARVLGVGKSTVHTDVTERLPRIDAAQYRQVCAILQRNHDCRHLRGGESTRRKYLALKEDAASQNG